MESPNAGPADAHSRATGAGTRFRVTFGRGVGDAVIEDTKVDRPNRWTALSRSRVLDAESEERVLDAPDGSRLIINTRLHPHGILRLPTPALGRWMQRTWEKDLRTVNADSSTMSRGFPRLTPQRTSSLSGYQCLLQ
jgi:hypothetical protein